MPSPPASFPAAKDTEDFPLFEMPSLLSKNFLALTDLLILLTRNDVTRAYCPAEEAV